MRMPLTVVATILAAHLSTAGCVLSGGKDESARALELHLSLCRPQVLQYEPVVVELQVTNVSDKKQLIVSDLDPARGFVTYEIVGPDGTPQRYEALSQMDGEVAEQELAPKESLRHRELLLYSFGWGVHFREPGQYQIRCLFHDPLRNGPHTALRSTAATVTVLPAQGMELHAMEHFRGKPQAKFLVGATTAWAIADEFEAILREYPKSA